jgi:hypothetical protein
MTQQIIVGAIVALAALYAIWRWMPAAWRRSAAGRLATGARRAGWVDAGRANALAATLSKSSGCGACESCGSCGSRGSRGATATATATASAGTGTGDGTRAGEAARTAGR